MPRSTAKRPNRLAQLRKSEGVTVDALAEQLGLNPVDLRRWEENGTIPAEVQTRLAARFGVDVSWLTGAESLPSDVIRRDRTRSVPDRITGGHGDAAFADYVWSASYSYRFGTPRSMEH